MPRETGLVDETPLDFRPPNKYRFMLNLDSGRALSFFINTNKPSAGGLIAKVEKARLTQRKIDVDYEQTGDPKNPREMVA